MKTDFQLKTILNHLERSEAAEVLNISLTALEAYETNAREPRDEVKENINKVFKNVATLKEHRQALDLTQERLAYFVGVNERTIRKWEAEGLRSVKASKLAILSTVLDVSIDTLLK